MAHVHLGHGPRLSDTGCQILFPTLCSFAGGKKNGSVSGGDSQLSRVEIPPEVLLKAGPDRTQS